jgi:hypothetical protein
MRQIRGLYGTQPAIEKIRDRRLGGFRAFSAGRAFFIYKPRSYTNRDGKITRFSLDFFHLRHGHDLYERIITDAPKVYLQSALGRAELGKVFVHAGHATAKKWFPFDQDHTEAGFGGFHSGAQPGYPAACDKNCPGAILSISHTTPPLLLISPKSPFLGIFDSQTSGAVKPPAETGTTFGGCFFNLNE